MDYYSFEYLILMSLANELKIESINIDTDMYDAMKTIRKNSGELETKVVSRMMINDSIRLNFDLDFHYEGFYEEFTTPSGETIVAFGEYGYDG